MLSKHFNLITSFSAVLFFASCASNEIGQSKDVNQETIYQEYRLEYSDTEENAEMIAQFRFAGANGTTLVLSHPSKFEYNGKAVSVDSSGIGGAFYGSTIFAEKVIGKHTLVFTDIDNKKYENSFFVDSFKLLDLPGYVSKLTPALIKFKAPVLQAEDYIEINSDDTDSSFSIKYTGSDNSGYLTIPVEQLQRQTKNSFSIIATLHRKISLQQQAKEGGEITIIQTIKPVKIQLREEAL